MKYAYVMLWWYDGIKYVIRWNVYDANIRLHDVNAIICYVNIKIWCYNAIDDMMTQCYDVMIMKWYDDMLLSS